VFDPAEIKERRLQDEDRVIAQRDRPERHQLVNSTLSDNPVIAPDTIFPDPELAAGFAYNRISLRTQYLFCSMHEDHDYPVATYESPDPPRVQRRYDLAGAFHIAVSRALSMMFVHHLEVPYLWHYKRDAFSVLEESGRSSVQFLDRDELWKLFELGIRFRAIYERNNHTTAIWDKIKTRKSSPELSVAEKYLEDKLLRSICMMSIEAAAEGGDWLEYHYRDEIRRIKEQETAEDGVVKKLPAKAAQDDVRSGPILKLVEVGPWRPGLKKYYGLSSLCRRSVSWSRRSQWHSTISKESQSHPPIATNVHLSSPKSSRVTARHSLMPRSH
jgi:transcription elongation factor SPT6